METYFYESGRIQELLDLIIEKLFTVCLLTGGDADNEFSKGRILVQRIGQNLREASGLPPELAQSAILQLIEQRLPDKRVMENLPAFYSVMERMIREGLEGSALTPGAKNEEGIKPGKAWGERTESSGESETALTGEKRGRESEVALAGENKGPESEKAYGAQEFPREKEGRAIFRLPLPLSEERPGKSKEIRVLPGKAEAFSLKKPESAKGIARTAGMPAEAASLNYVLKQIFPESSIRWNYNLAGTRFMAQVEDLLIYRTDKEDKVALSLEKQGWRLVLCSQEDLAYPRRLERFIRHALRKRKRSINKA